MNHKSINNEQSSLHVSGDFSRFGQSVSSPLVPVESYMYYCYCNNAILLRLIQGKDYKISILVKN
jgi:hypothetical protein